jgi:hypothetical protein
MDNPEKQATLGEHDTGNIGHMTLATKGTGHWQHRVQDTVASVMYPMLPLSCALCCQCLVPYVASHWQHRAHDTGNIGYMTLAT